MAQAKSSRHTTTKSAARIRSSRPAHGTRKKAADGFVVHALLGAEAPDLGGDDPVGVLTREPVLAREAAESIARGADLLAARLGVSLWSAVQRASDAPSLVRNTGLWPHIESDDIDEDEVEDVADEVDFDDDDDDGGYDDPEEEDDLFRDDYDD